jgi:MFS family permease
VLLIAVVAIAATVLFAAMDNVAEVFFAENVLHAGNWGYGALAAAWLLGMAAGAALVASRLPEDRLASAILLASLGGGASVAAAAAFPTVVLALVLFALGGVANGVESVSMRSLIHHRTPDQLRGRVFSAYFGLAMAGQLGATALGGILVAVLHSRAVLVIGGAGGALAGLVGLAWLAALPADARAPTVVVLPEAGAVVTHGIVYVRDITPPEDVVIEVQEMLPSAERPS